VPRICATSEKGTPPSRNIPETTPCEFRATHAHALTEHALTAHALTACTLPVSAPARRLAAPRKSCAEWVSSHSEYPQGPVVQRNSYHYQLHIHIYLPELSISQGTIARPSVRLWGHTTSGSAPQLTAYPITSARTRARSIVLPAPDQNGARIQSRGAVSNTVYAAFPNRLSGDHECRQCLIHRPFTNTLILDPLPSDAHARTTSPTNFSTSTF
jgi:hypothetical protein